MGYAAGDQEGVVTCFGRQATVVFVRGLPRGRSVAYPTPKEDGARDNYANVPFCWTAYDMKRTRRSKAFLITAHWVGGTDA